MNSFDKSRVVSLVLGSPKQHGSDMNLGGEVKDQSGWIYNSTQQILNGWEK